jgi:transposase
LGWQSVKPMPEKTTFLALAHVQRGMNKASIARMLKVIRGNVNKWVAFFLDLSLSGLENKPHPGRPPKLAQIECKKIATFIDE